MGRSVDYSRLANLSLEERLKVLCQLFQSEWQRGDVPSVPEFLLMAPAGERPLLLAHLVDLDIAFRKERGEWASPSEYLEKYPYDSTILREQIESTAESDDAGIRSTQTFRRPQLPANDPEIVIPADLSQFQTRAIPFERLGRYLLRELLGKGGFGEVYRAYDPKLERDVALKTLLPQRAGVAEADELLLKEARKLAQLQHPGIVRVYDADFDQGQHFIVSELLAGGTLADRLRDYRFEWPEAATMIAEIAEALHYAHLRGIVHRDLKPQNILFDEELKPHLADFGLAVTEEEQLSEPTGTLGTYAYMPPEVMSGGGNIADARSDIYSLGSILYQLLTERLLFVAKNREQWRRQVLERVPKAPRLIVKTIPIEVEQICLKCLSKDPAGRYATAWDLAQELKARVATEISAQKVRQRVGAGRRLFPWIAGVGLVAMGVGVAIFLALQEPISETTVDNTITTDFAKFPDVAEFDPANAPNDKWIRLLVKPPKILAWPVDKRDSSIRHDASKFEVFASCDQMGLLELGETDLADFDLKVNLRQNAWEGDIGIFVGHQDAPDIGPSCKRCQFIVLKRRTGVHKPQTELQLISSTLKETGETMNEEFQLISGPEPVTSRERVLLIEVRKNRLKTVQWGSARTNIDEEKMPMASRLNKCSGRFGVFLSKASGYFRGVHVRSHSPTIEN